MTNRQRLFNQIIAQQNKAFERVTSPAEWTRVTKVRPCCPEDWIKLYRAAPGYDGE